MTICSRKRVVILGATGSIGSQALDIVGRFPDRFELLGLVSGRRPAPQAARFKITADDPDFEDRLEALVTHPDCDVVLVAIPGARSLRPTVAALQAGKVVALATKEVMVMAGHLVMELASLNSIRPVDSEHSAIWQCLWGESYEHVSRLILTASGGPFWRRPQLDLDQVTVEEALVHPRWSMGPKVTIDCATLMNKGLELIEAHHLFSIGVDQIDVVIHPQSLIHSLVEFVDGSSKAQVGRPDMRVPIGLGLSYPDRLPGVVAPTDFEQVGTLELLPLDAQRFPAVSPARHAARQGPLYPAVLNAADEEAVAAFLGRKLRFSQIVPMVEEALSAFTSWVGPAGRPVSLDDVIDADRFGRQHIQAKIG
jgi:1-deoxy-D-xylulose-5-phosphate reductoisomerase